MGAIERVRAMLGRGVYEDDAETRAALADLDAVARVVAGAIAMTDATDPDAYVRAMGDTIRAVRDMRGDL
jgi:hypothetical protein